MYTTINQVLNSKKQRVCQELKYSSDIRDHPQMMSKKFPPYFQLRDVIYELSLICTDNLILVEGKMKSYHKLRRTSKEKGFKSLKRKNIV